MASVAFLFSTLSNSNNTGLSLIGSAMTLWR